MRIGFIGLGHMGRGMARRLIEAGFAVTVHDVVAEAAAALGAAGAQVAPSVAGLAAASDVVVSILPGDGALEAVSTGAGGLVAALPRGAVSLVMGTHAGGTIAGLAAAHGRAGQALVAAPVFGRPEQAAAGELGIVAGGPAAAIDSCRPLFAVLGRYLIEAGPAPEAASAIKIANNLMLGCAIEAMGEAFALVRKCGVDPAVFHAALTRGVFGGIAHQVYGRIIAEEDYDAVGITATLGLKDADLALAAAAAAGVPLPSGRVWRDRLAAAIARGEGNRDWAVVALEQARASGLA